MRKNGFTFIEILIVTGIIAMVMTSVVGILSMSFRSQNKIKALDKLNKNSLFAIGEIRRNVVNGVDIVCSASGIGVSSFDVVDGENGDTTSIICNEGGKIASESANRSDLTGTGVVVSGCDNFVVCNLNNMDNRILSLDINYTLSSAVSGLGVTKTYTNKITVR